MFSSINMSDLQASSVESKKIHGRVGPNENFKIDRTVEQNEDFKMADGEIWRRNQKPLGEGSYSQVYLYENSILL